ncbi:MAG: hypothetical protein R2875_11720 [Desulfobacterales bacterium]
MPGSCVLHKVIQQLDGTFEPPMIFRTGVWPAGYIAACPLDAVLVKQVS